MYTIKRNYILWVLMREIRHLKSEAYLLQNLYSVSVNFLKKFFVEIAEVVAILIIFVPNVYFIARNQIKIKLKMYLEIGNKVAVLDDVLKGVVVAVDGDAVSFQTEDGMVFKFASSELIKVGVEQHKLTKYSDINNSLFNQKASLKKQNRSPFKKEKNEVTLEVDLHINQLTKSIKGLDNFDMLNLQLDTAKRKIEYVLSKKIPKIVFIHGVGEGVLKTELHYLLNKYPVKYYDASYKKYGLGATEVYVFQNPN